MARKASKTPPYVPRKGLRAILDHVQNHGPGELLSKEELHKRGLSSHWTYPALAALRFLGILDEGDRLTGKHLAFSQEKPDRQAQRAILKEAYADFFEAVSLPMASLEEVRKAFQEVYDLSERVTVSAFPVFQMLAEEAGLELVGAKERPPAQPRLETPEEGQGASKEPPPSGDEGEDSLLKRVSVGEEAVRIRHTGYQIVLNLQVTKYTTEKDIIKMIRTANRAIHLMKKAGDRH
ncbi:MAG: DUF5343 domain-containing protein [Acidobacteriota bacterium]